MVDRYNYSKYRLLEGIINTTTEIIHFLLILYSHLSMLHGSLVDHSDIDAKSASNSDSLNSSPTSNPGGCISLWEE